MGWSDSGGPPNHENEAFVWDQINGMRSVRNILSDAGVDIIGWWIERGTGISDDGTIITGYGDNPDGYTEAWITDISGSVPAAVPVPGAIWLFGSGLLGLNGISRHKKQHKDFI